MLSTDRLIEPRRVVDPGPVVAWVHHTASQLGYSRVRLDRGQLVAGYPANQGPYYEVGYGCGQVQVTTSHAGVVIVTRDLNSGKQDEIRALLRLNTAGGQS